MIVMSPGSSRAAYQWLSALGHELEPAVASLFTFTINNALLQGLAGLSVQDAEVTLMSSVAGNKRGKKKLKQRGPILITHQGLSGPAVLRLSAFGARQLPWALVNFRLLRLPGPLSNARRVPGCFGMHFSVAPFHRDDVSECSEHEVNSKWLK